MTTLNKLTLADALVGLVELGIAHELIGPIRNVKKVCSLLHKEEGGLYYYTGRDQGLIDSLQDSVMICDRSVARMTGSCSCIAVDEDPQMVFYRLCGYLFDTRPKAGIHPTAIIHPEAEIADDVHVGPYAVIGRSRIGARTEIHAHVVIMDGCIIGERVVIEPNSCIGATGVAWIWSAQGERVILPQLGGVQIGDEVFLGTDVTIVRGMINEATIIGRGCMIAHGSKIGHSVRMGVDCHVANNVSIAGSASLGARCFLGAGCSIRPHTTLAEGTIVGVGAAVVKDILEPGAILAGVPAKVLPKKENPSGMPKPH